MSWLEGLAQDDWAEWHSNSEVQTTAQAALDLLKEQEPRTAHWFISEYEYLTCSHCGESYYTGAESTEEARQRLAGGRYYKFCPHCGARMDAQEVKWE